MLTKEQFEQGWVLVRHNDSYLGELKDRIQIKDIYADFKQRLCEELRIDFSPFASKQLIDTTDQEASREA